MIILIGGVGCAGKTLMAQKLLEKYKAPYLSIDHLKMGIYRSDDKCGFTPLDSLEHIGEKLWGILKGIIMTNIENKQHLIIEGIYLMPEKIKELELDEEYSPEIISFYMGFSRGYIEKKFQSVIRKHMGAIENRSPKDDDDMKKEIYILENAKVKKMCEDGGAKYFEIDGEYNQEINKIYEWIDGKVRKLKLDGGLNVFR